jgi:histidinol phosphatase-like PHP family hydrolase
MISLNKSQSKDIDEKDIMQVDMHYHTVYSDGAANINQILKKIRMLGIGVAISDHNEIKGVLEIFKKKNKTDLVIPGIEVKSNENIDVLFYFYNLDDLKLFYKKEIIRNKKNFLIWSKTTIPLKKIIALIKKYKCVASIAHPYGYDMRVGSKSMMDEHDDIISKQNIFEAINGGTKRVNNQKSIDYIVKNKKYFTGGSDGHSIFALGDVVTCSRSKNVTEFLDNIMSRKTFVVGQEMKLHKFGEYFYWGLNKLGISR